MTEQLLLPLPPVRLPISVHLRTTETLPSPHLLPLGASDPGMITGIVARYRMRPDCDETPHRSVEALHVTGALGPRALAYGDLDAITKTCAARALKTGLSGGERMHENVLQWSVVSDPTCYDIYEFTFAEARIVMDARALTDRDALLEEVEASRSAIRPCVIEAFGAPQPLARRYVADRHLNQVFALLPEHMRPPRTFGRLVMWD